MNREKEETKFFAFASNAKSFAFACVVVVFFLLLLVGVLAMDLQNFLLKAFLDSLPRTFVTRIGEFPKGYLINTATCLFAHH